MNGGITERYREYFQRVLDMLTAKQKVNIFKLLNKPFKNIRLQ